ncbi:thioredoxin family protein [Extensimonas sp. H3M7-6]|jgi:thiol-disulfide isomerase/thioredoxin|uniref:thioredoxin family protein n=1 Tax=Extensimonas soli TaxID=3031322 RepID=UPI0023DB727D|nr:thioredoxin family protein [Extensimonas sp. H3M7-6]MDF1482604.1 thioredoxin family protein [Extensimonas sp. H3M7-6]
MSATAIPATTDPARGWWAICLCAAWCGTCGSYRSVFDALAAAHPQVRFEWVDIEDEADLVDELDVETFPTLLLADGHTARFLGPLLPQAGALAQLLARLPREPGASAGPEAQAVFERVRAARGK